jgi:hypothetical protein
MTVKNPFLGKSTACAIRLNFRWRPGGIKTGLCLGVFALG